MPSRIQHIKLACKDTAVINAFLTQVCEMPDGWSMGGRMGDRSAVEPIPLDQPLGPGGDLPLSIIMERRNANDGGPGFITGDTNSRQFQLVSSDTPGVWGICISTRNFEAVMEKAKARGIPCTPATVVDFNERNNIRNFFCIVDDIMFEVIRVESKDETAESEARAGTDIFG